MVKKAKKTVKKVVKKAAKKVKSSKLYQKAKKTATKIKKKVCTTEKWIQKATVSFVKNVDWKKVAIGAVAAVAIAGAVALIGGAIGGTIAGGTAVMFNQAANAGSSMAGNYAVRQAVDVGTDTMLDTARAVARGEDVNAKTIGRDLLTNTLMAGARAAGGSGKNGIVDGSGNGKAGTGRSEIPSELAKSWQGTGKYPGVDKYKDITLKQGKVVYRGEPNGTEYFTTKTAIERSGNNATKIFEGLQVEKNPIHGYRDTMQAYKVVKDVDAAMGITKANPQFGKGGLPQIFVPNANELIKQGILVPVESIPLVK